MHCSSSGRSRLVRIFLLAVPHLTALVLTVICISQGKYAPTHAHPIHKSSDILLQYIFLLECDPVVDLANSFLPAGSQARISIVLTIFLDSFCLTVYQGDDDGNESLVEALPVNTRWSWSDSTGCQLAVTLQPRPINSLH
ncbi:hypothetical protein OF83DRAFT_70861 [Amylostereum chailletii]|nr:hypothetical protein OF83DRAFT_70861 [Amylostereum chailletii]